MCLKITEMFKNFVHLNIPVITQLNKSNFLGNSLKNTTVLKDNRWHTWDSILKLKYGIYMTGGLQTCRHWNFIIITKCKSEVTYTKVNNYCYCVNYKAEPFPVKLNNKLTWHLHFILIILWKPILFIQTYALNKTICLSQNYSFKILYKLCRYSK